MQQPQRSIAAATPIQPFGPRELVTDNALRARARAETEARRAAVTPEDIQNARTVIAHPEIFANDPIYRLDAWQVLVHASGSAFYRDRVRQFCGFNPGVNRGAP